MRREYSARDAISNLNPIAVQIVDETRVQGIFANYWARSVDVFSVRLRRFIPFFSSFGLAMLALTAGRVALMGAPGQIEEFSVVEAVEVAGERVEFRVIRTRGREVIGAKQGARRRVPAMDQNNFPEPESACGPIAMLNWMLWLEQQRVLPLSFSTDVEARAQSLYPEIESTLEDLRHAPDRSLRGPTSIREIAAGMDRLVKSRSDGAIRMHAQPVEVPLKVVDVLESTKTFRCGILIVRIVEDEKSGELGEYHAVSLISGDRGGGLMINNWGVQVYGQLRNERGGQFFRAQNAEHPTLKVEGAMFFVPFEPTNP